jgi:hypothetical protein
MSKTLVAAVLPSLAPGFAGTTKAQDSCPDPGDVARGSLDESTVPPTWNIEPEGAIDIGDVVALLRTAVGIQQPAPFPWTSRCRRKSSSRILRPAVP